MNFILNLHLSILTPPIRRNSLVLNCAKAKIGRCEKRFAALIVGAISLHVATISHGNTFVRLDYNFSLASRSRNTAFIELFDDRPLTRDNFLQYVDAGRYDDSFMQRLARNFVVQGGGFYPAFQSEPPPLNLSLSPSSQIDLDGNPATPNPTVVNEFGNVPIRSNGRGTLAMAKSAGDPNSATSQWFVNLLNNAGAAPNGLDFQNGGFTVFAQVSGDGMVLFDAFNTLSINNLNPDVNDDGVREPGPFGANLNDGVPSADSRLVVLENAGRVDYLGAGTLTNVPSTDLTLAANNVFIDTGAAITGTGRMIVDTGHALGIRENVSLTTPILNRGTLAPGLRLGVVTIPAFEQTSQGTLDIDLRGTVPDLQHDQINVNGIAILDGKLRVSLLDGFNPAIGQSCTVLTASTIQGQFSEIELPMLDTGLRWKLAASSTAISLQVVAIPEPSAPFFAIAASAILAVLRKVRQPIHAK